MGRSLQGRIHDLVCAVLDGYPGAWLVWCDPRGDWAPLLERVATDERMGPFSLLTVDESTGGEAGSPLARRQLQERLDVGESLVLLVRAGREELGWLWAQALEAERIYMRSLRDQVQEWGWRPQSLTMGDDELAALARQGLGQDPHEWGWGGLQPDPALLVRALAGVERPRGDALMVLEATIEAAGLPPLDRDDLAALAAPSVLDDDSGDADALRRWRLRALARLLVTQAHEAAPGLVPEGRELLITPERRAEALGALARWADSVSLRGRLAEAVVEADKIAALGNLPAPLPGAAPFLSRAAEAAAFSLVCRGLATARGLELLEALAARRDDLRRHAEGFWGAEGAKDRAGLPATPWCEAARLATAARDLLDASPADDWPTPDHAIAWYVERGWRVDRAGDELLRALEGPSPDLVALIAPLREAYRNRWEDLLIRWSSVWSAAGCPPRPGDLRSAGTWLKEALTGKAPAAIIVVDALRFDLGAAIAARINREEGAQRAQVTAARAPLPSITALGMGLALPIDEADLDAALVGKAWELRQRGVELDLSAAAGRRAWWQDYGGVRPDALVSLAAIREATIPEPEALRGRLVIYDDAIDQLGHDDELEALGAGTLIERYVAVIARLREAGWRRILLVTDHGYIHWSGTAERQVSPPEPFPLYTTRRALAYPADTRLPAPHALSPGGHYAIALASGASCFKTYGGLGYFHGGASLQEWVIPCVWVEWPAEARPVEVALRPLPRILSLNVRVTLVITRPGLLAEDALARRVTMVARRADTREILFRSEEVALTPDQDTALVILQPTDIRAPRNAPVLLEVRDAKTEESLAEGESVLMVQKDDWIDTGAAGDAGGW